MSEFPPPPPSTLNTTLPQLLTRLGELHSQAHMHSTRTRRAAVAIILRVRDTAPTMDDTSTSASSTLADFQQQVHLRSTKKVKSVKPKKSAAAPPAPSASSSAASGSAVTPATPPAEPDLMVRHVPDRSPQRTAEIESRLASLSSASNPSTSLIEILYIQRAKNPTDRWSGQMAFPGGRQSKGESDQTTCVREVEEEIGWDLKDQEKFVCLGQLDDKPMDGLKNVKPLAVAIFVYLQLCRHSPPLVLEPTEVSAILFVPITYFQSLRSSHDFGRIYHPLMLQILSRTPAAGNDKGAATYSSASHHPAALPPQQHSVLPSFDLKLIGWPHKREGRPMTRAGEDQLSHEQRATLDQLDDDDHHSSSSQQQNQNQQQHISEIDETPFMNTSLFNTLRTKVQTLAHDIPLLVSSRTVHLPTTAAGGIQQFLPRVEQLASLRFPALSLPGIWYDTEGRAGRSTGDDIRTASYQPIVKTVTEATESQHPQEQKQQLTIDRPAESTFAVPLCPPPFILWGMTLEKSCELVSFLGFPFAAHYLQRGSASRKRKYQFWSGVGEARWEVERIGERMKQVRTQVLIGVPSVTPMNHAQAGVAVAQSPLTISAFSPASSSSSTTQSPSTTSTQPLAVSPYSTPLLMSKLKQRLSESIERQKMKLRSRL